MDIKTLLTPVYDCPCGRVHTTDVKDIRIESGVLSKTADILKENDFGKKLLAVADKNTISAADGILDILADGGYDVKIKLYDDLRVADMTEVRVIEALCDNTDGVLSIGTGSLNDICRLASYRKDKPFAIFATAPSMDGFASDTAPITDNNFKMSYQARQPKVIIADTKILAAAPAYLKSAGFGDMIAKYIGLADWKITHLVTDEYYCDYVAGITQEAVERIVALADKITIPDEETAGAVMEALVFTGVAMKLAGCSRPASGAEHIVSHFWEVKKLENGILSDFHGKKCGVATILINRMYHEMAAHETVDAHYEHIDWNRVAEVYGPRLYEDVKKLNNPTITEGITPEKLNECWSEIRNIIYSTLPTEEELMRIMKLAGAATTIEEIAVSEELCELGLEYHPYMRHRLNLSRLRPMLGF